MKNKKNILFLVSLIIEILQMTIFSFANFLIAYHPKKDSAWIDMLIENYQEISHQEALVLDNS